MIFNFNNTYSKLPPELFSKVSPAKISKPQLVIFNNELASELDLNIENISNAELAEIFSGNKLPQNATPIAQAYGGHQFGHFNMLGDGRAILLGEQLNSEGKRSDIQLKGSGITPYSRRGDGKATLSSMVREHIFSEAMHALGIPTTRSLAVVSTGEPVYREQANEGGILTRVADSHIRTGTFQYARHFCNEKTQKELTEYTLNRHFPELSLNTTPALSLIKAVMDKQTDLIVHWMRVGFIHGVMNTDNMLLSGETIDYGPCAFMNTYNPATVFRSIDTQGRYAYENQPGIALWNITRFAETLLPQINSDTDKAITKVREVLSTYESSFRDKFISMMFRKIGISNPDKDDNKLLSRLTTLMEKHKADYTNTFVQLMYPDMELNDSFRNNDFAEWVSDWKKRIINEPDYMNIMKTHNPVFIARNNLVENSLSELSQNGNIEPFNNLMSVLENPYSFNMDSSDLMNPPEEIFDSSYKTFCGT